MYIQDENKFNNYQYGKRVGMGHNRATVFYCHWKKGVMGRDGNLALCSGICLLFFENYKKGLLRAESVALYLHVTHYGPRPDNFEEN